MSSALGDLVGSATTTENIAEGKKKSVTRIEFKKFCENNVSLALTHPIAHSIAHPSTVLFQYLTHLLARLLVPRSSARLAARDRLRRVGEVPQGATGHRRAVSDGDGGTLFKKNTA